MSAISTIIRARRVNFDDDFDGIILLQNLEHDDNDWTTPIPPEAQVPQHKLMRLYDVNNSELENLDFFKDSFAALGKMAKKTSKVIDRGIERKKKALADDLELTGKYVKKNGNFIGSDLYASIASGTGELLNHGIDKKKLLTPKQQKALANQRKRAQKLKREEAARKAQEKKEKEEFLRQQQAEKEQRAYEQEQRMAQIQAQKELALAKQQAEDERRAAAEEAERELEAQRQAALAKAAQEKAEKEKQLALEKAKKEAEAKRLAQQLAEENARKEAEAKKQRELDEAVQKYLQSHPQTISPSRPIVGSSHSSHSDRRYDSYQDEQPQTVNINYNYGQPRSSRYARDDYLDEQDYSHSRRHSRSHRGSYDDYDDYRSYSPRRHHNSWNDYDLYNLDAQVDLTKNVGAPELKSSDATFGELMKGVSNGDFYLIMSVATILIMAWVFFTYTALKNVFGKKPASIKKMEQRKESADLVDKLFA